MIINATGVIDITNDTPLKEDFFFVDTNVWFWLTYERASLGSYKPRTYQLQSYPEYIEAAYLSESTIYRSGLSLSELAHQIEKVERDIYCSTTGLNIKTKDFRRNYPTERMDVVEQIELSWEQVKQMGRPIETQLINESINDSALSRLKTQMIDGYDLFLMEFANASGIKNIISDDGDIASVPDIYLFTANKTVIDNAKLQGKFIER